MFRKPPTSGCKEPQYCTGMMPKSSNSPEQTQKILYCFLKKDSGGALHSTSM